MLIVGDPDFVHELYVTNNKYFDKDISNQCHWQLLLGEATISSPSNENWALKRKHITSSFC